jgi:acetyl esterase/lipase
MMTWFREHYLGGGDRQGPSPWFWADVRNSAPAIIHTAGFDPLVDEGDAWANRLREAGVTVRHQRYESLVHGFLALGGVVRAARGAADDLCREIVEMLGE